MPQNTIVFIQERPSLRVLKIGKALRRSGKFQVILFFLRELEFIHPSNEFDDYFCYDFSKTLTMISSEKAIGFFHNRFESFDRRKMMKQLQAITDLKAIHAISPPPKLCKWAIDTGVSPVVFDQYDLLIQSYGKKNVNRRQYYDELYCLENARAVVHKGPKEEIIYYKDKFHISPKLEISFPDFCDNDLFINMEKMEKITNKETHFVYVGNISLRYSDYDLLWLSDILSKQRIHLHVFPLSNTPNDTIKEYIRVSQTSDYLHIHRTVPHSQLSSEISKYHYGVYIINPNFQTTNTRQKWGTAAGNKIPAYWEAGLPIIILNELSYSSEIVRKYKAGIIIKLDELEHLSKIISKTDYNKLQDNVGTARERFSIYKNISVLERLYSNL